MVTHSLDIPTNSNRSTPNPWMSRLGWALQAYYGIFIILGCVHNFRFDLGSNYLHISINYWRNVTALLVPLAGIIASYEYRKRRTGGLYLLAAFMAIYACAAIPLLLLVFFAGWGNAPDAGGIVLGIVFGGIALLHISAIVIGVKNVEQMH